MQLRQMAGQDAGGQAAANGEPRVFKGRSPDDNKFSPLDSASKRPGSKTSLEGIVTLMKPGMPPFTPHPPPTDIKLPRVASSRRSSLPGEGQQSLPISGSLPDVLQAQPGPLSAGSIPKSPLQHHGTLS